MTDDERHSRLRIAARLGMFEAAAEATKTRLTQALHDDLGGLLGAAMMDVVWAEDCARADPVITLRLGAIKQTLLKAIMLKRQVVEEICPTLIENVGLIAAVRWYHRRHCDVNKLQCGATYPDSEIPFSPGAAKALFRIVEEALMMVGRQPTAQTAHLSIDTSRDEIVIRIIHDGERMSVGTRTDADLTSLWLLEHRVLGLGGKVSVHHPIPGGMELKAEVPLKDIVANG